MAYVKQNFVKGQILTAEHMNHIEDGIVAAADAQSLGGKAPEYYLQPRNLLDNSDFTNPVNQRGATEYNGNSYGIDRWCGTAQYQTVSIQNNYITISATGLAYCGIRQKLENMGKLSGKTITFAAQIYSSVGTYIAFMDESGNSIIHVDGVAGQKQILVLTYTIPSNATSDNVVPTIVCRTQAKGDSANIYWAALYEGVYTADTLPPYVPKGYAAELAECQRYFRKTVLHGVAETAKYIAPANTFEPPFRIVPTITADTDTTFGAPGVGGPSASDISFIVYNDFVQEIVDNNSSLTPGVLYRLYITASADL